MCFSSRKICSSCKYYMFCQKKIVCFKKIYIALYVLTNALISRYQHQLVKHFCVFSTSISRYFLFKYYHNNYSFFVKRLYDGKVMTQEEMQSIFPTARLGMLFHVPRLKRTSHGRPTGVSNIYFTLHFEYFSLPI